MINNSLKLKMHSIDRGMCDLLHKSTINNSLISNILNTTININCINSILIYDDFENYINRRTDE